MSTKLRTCTGCNVALGRSEFSKNQVRGILIRRNALSSYLPTCGNSQNDVCANSDDSLTTGSKTAIPCLFESFEEFLHFFALND